MAEGTERDEAAVADGPSSKRARPYEESVSGRSDVDAMGNDKRRAVIGGQYGASARKRLLFWGIVVGVIVALAIVSLTVVSNVDNAEIALKETAPWTEVEGPLEQPRDLDFIREGGGPPNNIPPEEIVNR